MPDAAVMSLSGLNRPGILRTLSFIDLHLWICNDVQYLFARICMQAMTEPIRVRLCMHDAMRESPCRHHVEHVTPMEATSAGC